MIHTWVYVQVLFNFLTMMRQRKAEALEAAGQELHLLALDQGSVTAALDAHTAREAKRARRGSPPGSNSVLPPLPASSCPASPSRLLRMADSAAAAGGGGTFALLGGGGGGGCGGSREDTPLVAFAIAPRLRSAPQRRSSLASLMAAAQLPASSSAAASASEAAAAAAQALAVQGAAAEATWRRVSHAYPQLERNFFSRRAEAEVEAGTVTGKGAQVQLSTATLNQHPSSFPAAFFSPSREATAPPSLPSSSPASTLPEHLRSFSHDLQQYSRYSRFDVAACLQYGESKAVLAVQPV